MNAPAASHAPLSAEAEPLRLSDTDWLYHRLIIEGPADVVATIAMAARGAGIVPWALDMAVMEEDLFHWLITGSPSGTDRLGLQAARALARQLCEASATRHAAALAHVGISQACPFDLHALLPVPPEILRLGFDDPVSDLWLWQHWGTTQALRHVELAPPTRRRAHLAADHSSLHVRFWSADWTPWRAFRTLAKRWPGVRFKVQPVYEPT